MPELRPYVSTMSERLAPGKFVTTWNGDLGRNAVGIICGVEDPQESNPRLLVNWAHNQSTECELVRAEYLYLTDPIDFILEVGRCSHLESIAHKWRMEAAKHEAAAREIEEYGEGDEIDDTERMLNTSIAETLRQCEQDLMYPQRPKVAEEENKF